MEPVEGAQTFRTSGAAYDGFMGRYSSRLGPVFADSVGVAAGQRVLDVGCGPGALTAALVDRVGPDMVSACDPSPTFVADFAVRHPGVDIRTGAAEALPFDDGSFDVALAQLVLHFVTDPARAAAELRRVVRPGGIVGACMWDFDAGMEMLRAFWDAAIALDPGAPDEARVLRFGRSGEIAELLEAAGITDVRESTLEVASSYADFDELWAGFLAGIGPAGSYCVALPQEHRDALRAGLFERLGSPAAGLTLNALARGAHGVSPGSSTSRER